MKLNEIKNISEGLKGNWTYGTVYHLTPAKLKALRINATKAADESVLNVIAQVVADKAELQKKKAAEKRADDKKWNSKNDDSPKKYTTAELQEIARKIEEFAGEAFPDGDPIDKLGPWMTKRFSLPRFTNISDALDLAAKKNLSSKSYSDYLAGMWEDYIDDVAPDRRAHGNPWK